MGSGPEMKSYIVFLSVCTSAVLKKQKTEKNKKNQFGMAKLFINHRGRVEG